MIMEPHVPSSWVDWIDGMEAKATRLGRQMGQTWWTRKEPASKSNTRNGRDLCVSTVMGQRLWQSHISLWFIAYLRWLLAAGVAIRAAVWSRTSL